MTKPPDASTVSSSDKPSDSWVGPMRERFRALADEIEQKVGGGPASGPPVQLSAEEARLAVLALRQFPLPHLGWQEIEKSENISHVAYDWSVSELWMIFKDKNNPRGRTYVYSGVPRTTYSQFLAADSKGGFLHANIKGKFDYKRVE